MDLLDKNDEAERFLIDLESNENSIVTESFKNKALNVINDNS